MYNQHFGGKSWPEVKPKYYEKHSDAYYQMDQSSLRQYIAGFLNFVLDQPDSWTAENLIYFAGCKQFIEFCSPMNNDQVCYLLSVIGWVVADEYFSKDDRNRIETAKKKLHRMGLA